MVAGIVSAVAGAALMAVAVVGKRRRDTKLKAVHVRAVPPANNDADNLEQDPGQPRHAQLPSYTAALALGNEGDKSPPPPYTPAGEAGHGDVAPRSALVVLTAGLTPSSSGLVANSAKGRGAGIFAGASTEADGSTEKSLTDTTSTATTSTANGSTCERAELAEFHRRQVAADATSSASGARPAEAPDGVTTAPSAADRPNSAGDIGLRQAVLAAAQELARSCQVPGVAEAAGVLCIMANLFTDSRENDKASDTRLRQCRSIVMALKRTEKVVGKVSCGYGLGGVS